MSQPRTDLRIPYLHIDRKNGLPSSQVHSVTIDGDDSVWLATPAGVCRYDGLRLEVYTQKHGLGTHGIRHVIANNKELLVGTDVGLDRKSSHQYAKKVSEDTFEQFPIDIDIGFVECMSISEKAYWLGTSNGLYRIDRFSNKEPIKQIFEGFIEQILKIDDSTFFVLGRPFGIRMLKRSHWEDMNFDLCSTEYIQLIANNQSNPNEIILACNHGLFKYNIVTTNVHSLAVELPEHKVTALDYSDEEIWLGTHEGLFYYESGRGNSAPIVCLEKHFINDILKDKHSHLWIATNDKGLYKFSSLRHVMDQHPSDSVFSVRQSRHQHTEKSPSYYLSTLRGLQLYSQHGGLEPYPNLENFHLHCWDALELPDGLLLATTEGLLHANVNGEYKKLSKQNLVASSPNRILYETKHSIYLGTQTGLVRINHDLSLHTQLSEQNDTLGYVYTIAEDKQNNLWVGTIGNGLWKGELQGDLLHSSDQMHYIFNRVQGGYIERDSNIYCIRLNPKGSLGIIQNNQVIQLWSEKKQKVLHTSQNAIAGWSMQWESEERLWVGGSSSLYELNIDSAQFVREIRVVPGSEIWEFNSSQSLYLATEQNDRRTLFCAMRQNFTALDVDKLRDIVVRPEIHLYNYTWLNADKALIEPKKIKTGKWVLKVELQTYWSLDVENLEFRYRLVGFDQDWSEMQSLREIRFTSLPVGHYHLEVQAYSPMFGWGRVSDIFHFQVLAASALPRFLHSTVDGYYSFKEQFLNYLRHKNLILQDKTHDEIVESKTQEFIIQTMELNRRNQELEEVSQIDGLTKIPNRRFLDRMLDKYFTEAVNNKSEICILFLDIDDFKAYNDYYGHVKGDEALREVASVVNSVMRGDMDFFGRYGGEEFMVVLPKANLNGALKLAERIQNAMRQAELQHDRAQNKENRITMSIGGVSFNAKSHENVDLKAVISWADKNLYKAKTNGKDQTVVSSYE